MALTEDLRRRSTFPGGVGCSEDKVEWPIPRRVLRRRQREALFVIERVFWEEVFSEFGYDEKRQVFFDHEGDVVLTRHYADRRVFEERGPESAAEEPGRDRAPVRCRRPS